MYKRQVVGKFPYQVGEMCGLNIPETAKIMLVKNQAWGEAEVLCREILFPIVRYTVYEKFEDAVDRAVANLEVEGAGHTSTLWLSLIHISPELIFCKTSCSRSGSVSISLSMRDAVSAEVISIVS